MSITASSRSLLARQDLTALDAITIGALIAGAIGYGWLQIQIGVFVLPIVIIVIGFLLVAALVASGWRWASLLATLYGVGIFVGAFVFAPEYTVLHLRHPDHASEFMAVLLGLAGAALALVTGGLSAWQTVRSAPRTTPSWTLPLVAGAVGLVLGALLTSIIVAANPATTESAAPVAVDTVHMTAVDFTAPTVVVARGGVLHLVDDGSSTHIFRNGSWDGNTARPAAEPGAPAVNDLMITHGSVDIGPFDSAGTFHIYCTVHPGMSLTIIVP